MTTSPYSIDLRERVIEYIESEKEISVEIININGQHHIIAMTDKYLTPPPFFAEIGQFRQSTMEIFV